MPRVKKRPSSLPEHTRFLTTLRYANAAAVELRVQHHQFTLLFAENQKHPEVLGSLTRSVFRWYLTWAIIGTRRLMDHSSDARSFRIALDYIANPKHGVKSFSGDPIHVAEVHEDRRSLIQLSKDVVTVASKCLAHAVDEADSMALSMGNLTEAIHRIESLSIKYMALVTGTAILTRDDGSTIQGKIAGTSLPLELVGSVWPVETTMPTVKP